MSPMIELPAERTKRYAQHVIWMIVEHRKEVDKMNEELANSSFMGKVVHFLRVFAFYAANKQPQAARCDDYKTPLNAAIELKNACEMAIEVWSGAQVQILMSYASLFNRTLNQIAEKSSERNDTVAVQDGSLPLSDLANCINAFNVISSSR